MVLMGDPQSSRIKSDPWVSFAAEINFNMAGYFIHRLLHFPQSGRGSLDRLIYILGGLEYGAEFNRRYTHLFIEHPVLEQPLPLLHHSLLF